ncbi:MAG TPA: DUF4259 domain-containing protein [Gaiellaceae bacterium]|jgi:hypothetical protein
MGAWGARSFENDDALDWVWELEDSSDDSVVRAAFAAVHGDGDVEAPEAACACAAAEVVAASAGRPATWLPNEVTAWVAAHGAAVVGLRGEARAAVQRIAAGSELQQLWAEAGAAEWDAGIADLLGRLAEA